MANHQQRICRHCRCVPMCLLSYPVMRRTLSTRNLDFGLGTGGDSVRVLSYAPEGIPVSRQDVVTYQSQLSNIKQQANLSALSANSITVGVSADVMDSSMANSSASLAETRRLFGLSDEPGKLNITVSAASAVAVAGVDKNKLEEIISGLQWDIDPISRPWAAQANPYQETVSVLQLRLECDIVKRTREKSNRSSVESSVSPTNQYFYNHLCVWRRTRTDNGSFDAAKFSNIQTSDDDDDASSRGERREERETLPDRCILSMLHPQWVQGAVLPRVHNQVL